MTPLTAGDRGVASVAQLAAWPFTSQPAVSGAATVGMVGLAAA